MLVHVIPLSVAVSDALKTNELFNLRRRGSRRRNEPID